MVCLYCGGETSVVNSRLQKRSNSIWRRRKCVACGAVFTSTESAEYTQALSLQRSTHTEPFSRDLLFLSVYDSLRHRKSAAADATALTITIMSKLLASTNQASIGRDELVRVAVDTLRRFDKVAATHYQAFHP